MLFECMNVFADNAAGSAAGTAGAAGAQGPASMISMFLPLIAMVLIFWFILIRPQKKKEKHRGR